MKDIKGLFFVLSVSLILLSACGSGKSGMTISGLNPADFDSTINGKKTELLTLTNDNGMEVCITNFGGRVVSIVVPDKDGTPTDVVLGYDNVAQYADRDSFPSDFGATIGRYANRINKGQLTIAGRQIQLPINDNGHCLHGGPTGWQYQIYDAEKTNDSTIVLKLVSPDGDNGFPGTVNVTATYVLRSDNALDCTYEATTDKETVINMCNHSYFDLNGHNTAIRSNTDQTLMINADSFTPIDDTYMTTGEIVPVEGTSMDFRTPKKIIDALDYNAQQNIYANYGYDHNWVLNTYKDGKGDDTQVAATLKSSKTGIELEVYTNEPGLQVYTGNFLDGTKAGKHGLKYAKNASVCLESQKFPDTPNKPEWPSATLKPGEKYISHVVYKFVTIGDESKSI